MNGTEEQRQELAQGLQDLAHQILVNPDLPIPVYGFTINVSGVALGLPEDATWSEIQAAVRAVGLALDVMPMFNADRTHMLVEVKLPGGISYRVVGIDPDAMARHDAEQSYRGVVDPA